MISAGDTVVQHEATLCSALDDDLIMIDVANGKYLTIDAIGAAIWQAIARPITVADLVEGLADHYAASREQIHVDVLAFLDNLASRGLVRIVPG
ncbi:MAG: PqqD family peptide modification chaperone [Sphingomonas sp.]|jgi:hypothetical protein|uniref:PqqD family peptide modification chaperone n=1 Tax=Sphingomonas sp. TaxID=28214 RepID=UPI0035669A3C